MDNKAIYNNSVKDNINSLREDYDNLGIDSLMEEINTKIDGNSELLNYCTNSEGTSGFDASLVVDSHGQLEAVKEILQDENIANEINVKNPDFIPEAMSKIEPLVESFKGLEDKYEMFKVEEKPVIEVDTTFKKIDLDTKGYDAKLNFGSLCDMFNIDKSSESINRYGKTSVYEANGKLDRNIEIKMIPVKEGIVSPFAVGRIDLGKNRELLFMGNVASDDSGKILPKLENVNFIGTDGFDSKIPKYLKGEDGRCTEIDLNKSQLKDFIPYGKFTDGKIDVKCSFDDIVKPFINNSGMYSIDNIGINGEQVVVMDDDFLKAVRDVSCLQFNVDTAVTELSKDFSDTIESGNISMEQVYEKSDTIIKLDKDNTTLKDIASGYMTCLNEAEGTKDVLDRVLNHLGKPEVVCTELSLAIPEIIKGRQGISVNSDKFDKFVDNYKTVNEAGVSKEGYVGELVGKYIERYNDALDKNTDIGIKDIKEALTLHIGENGFVYNGAGFDASELNDRIYNKDEIKVDDDNQYTDAVVSGQANRGLYSEVEKCDKDSILKENLRFSKEEIKDLSICAIGMPQVVNSHCQYLDSKGMSKEDIEKEVRCVYEKYISSDSDNIIADMKAYAKEVDNIVNERTEFNDVEVLPANVEDKKTNAFKDKMHDLYVNTNKKMELVSAKMGRLGHGDPLIMGYSMVKAFAGLMAGEVKYTDTSNKDKPVDKYYSVADVTVSFYNILTTSPNAIVQSVLYRVLLYACENTIDAFIRNNVDGLSDNIITDDIKKDFLETKVEDGKYVVDNGEQAKETPTTNEEVINETPVINDETTNNELVTNDGENSGENLTQEDNTNNKSDNVVVSNEGDENGVTSSQDETLEGVSNDGLDMSTNDGENSTVDNGTTLDNSDPITSDDGDEQDDPYTIEYDEEDLENFASVIEKEESITEEVVNEGISNESEDSVEGEQEDDTSNDGQENNDSVATSVEDITQDSKVELDNKVSDSENSLDNEGLTDDMKTQLVADVNNVVDEKIFSEQANSFGECFRTDSKEACGLIENTLSEKILGALGTEDEGKVIENAVNLVANITNPNNYTDLPESLETMINNINKKTNNKEIEDKIMSVIEGICDQPINNKAESVDGEQLPDDAAKKEEDEPKLEEVSMDIDGKTFEAVTLEDGSTLLLADGEEIDTTKAGIDAVVNEVGDKTEPIVSASVDANPIMDTDKIEQYTGIDVQGSINDLKNEVIDSLKQGITDLFTSSGIEMPTNDFSDNNSNNVDNSVDNSKFDTGNKDNISTDDGVKNNVDNTIHDKGANVDGATIPDVEIANTNNTENLLEDKLSDLFKPDPLE